MITKYYNKKIPTEIHFIYGGRKSGRTYYEVKKLKEECDFLKKDNFDWCKRYERLVNRIGRAVKLLENSSENNVKQAISILRSGE
jgi:hypothetical protein